MLHDHSPTERYDGSITVRILDDKEENKTVTCSSYTEAVDIVKEHQHSKAAVKIVDKDDDVVFNSVDMNIDHWEAEWKRAKRRMSVDVDEHDCPYDNVSCFADDLCVQCKMDKVQRQY